MQPCHVFEHQYRCTLHIALLTVANEAKHNDAAVLDGVERCASGDHWPLLVDAGTVVGGEKKNVAGVEVVYIKFAAAPSVTAIVDDLGADSLWDPLTALTSPSAASRMHSAM